MDTASCNVQSTDHALPCTNPTDELGCNYHHHHIRSTFYCIFTAFPRNPTNVWLGLSHMLLSNKFYILQRGLPDSRPNPLQGAVQC
jgi:hypothetical protein